MTPNIQRTQYAMYVTGPSYDQSQELHWQVRDVRPVCENEDGVQSKPGDRNFGGVAMSIESRKKKSVGMSPPTADTFAASRAARLHVPFSPSCYRVICLPDF